MNVFDQAKTVFIIDSFSLTDEEVLKILNLPASRNKYALVTNRRINMEVDVRNLNCNFMLSCYECPKHLEPDEMAEARIWYYVGFFKSTASAVSGITNMINNISNMPLGSSLLNIVGIDSKETRYELITNTVRPDGSLFQIPSVSRFTIVKYQDFMNRQSNNSTQARGGLLGQGANTAMVAGESDDEHIDEDNDAMAPFVPFPNFGSQILQLGPQDMEMLNRAAAGGLSGMFD